MFCVRLDFGLGDFFTPGGDNLFAKLLPVILEVTMERFFID